MSTSILSAKKVEGGAKAPPPVQPLSVKPQSRGGGRLPPPEIDFARFFPGWGF